MLALKVSIFLFLNGVIILYNEGGYIFEELMYMTKTEREKRELERLERSETFHGHDHYFAILIVVLSIVYIVDELASGVRGIVEVQTVRDLFNVVYPSSDFDNASATLGFVTMAGYMTYLISPFYKSLADRFGRKPFLVINTIGMGVGMLICVLSKTVTLYVIGAVVLTFFTPNDMQVMHRNSTERSYVPSPRDWL